MLCLSGFELYSRWVDRIDFIEGMRENYLGLQSPYEEQKYGSKIEDM